MKVIVDRRTDQVLGIDSNSSLFSLEIEVSDDFNFTKVIERTEGKVQQKDQQGNKLYKKPILTENFEPKIINGEKDYEAVTTPKIPKRFEEVKDEGGNVTKVPFTHPTTKVTYKVSQEDGSIKEITKAVSEVSEYEELEPLMVDKLIEEEISFIEQPREFTLQEVLAAKHQQALKNISKANIIADIFLNEDDINLADPNHSAHTGKAFVQLLPQGQVKLKAHSLTVLATDFEIIELKADPNVKLKINQLASDKIEIVFVNTSDEYQRVYSYIIGY